MLNDPRYERPVYADEVAAEDRGVVQERVVNRRSWSPAQIVALAAGLVLVVMGGIALARCGIHLDHLTARHANVAGLDHTAVLGGIELLAGLLLLAAGGTPYDARATMVPLGVASLAFGIVFLAQSSSFTGLSRSDGTGWMFVIGGIAVMVAGLASPVFRSRSHYGVTQRAYRNDRLITH